MHIRFFVVSFLALCLCCVAPNATFAQTAPGKKFNIPILVYHHVRPQQGWAKSTWSWKMTVTPATFEKHMQWLANNNYTGIDLTTMTKILKGELQGPVKPVVITFDDNNLNAYENALPILKKYYQKAVFYQVSNRLKNPGTIDEARTKELVKAGMFVESHTVSHATLTYLSLKKLDAELTESRKTLEALTGKPVFHLAYPSTAQNALVRERAKAAGYLTASIMDPRPVTEKDDWFKLPRIMMTDDTNLAKVLP